MEKEQEKPAYYSILTADVRYDKKITPNAKLLFSEITALCNKNGFCWATNSYFAELYDVTTQAVSKWINSLADNGYLELEYEYKGKEITKRKIYVNTNHKNRLEVSTQRLEVSTKDEGGINKRLIGYQQKIKDNITSINTKKNNKIEYPFLCDEVVEGSNETKGLFPDIPVQKEKPIKNKYSEEFERFWNEYPKKAGKEYSLKSFNKLIKEGLTIDIILQRLNTYKEKINKLKTDYEYIRNPKTFLDNIDDYNEHSPQQKTNNTAASTTNINQYSGFEAYMKELEKQKQEAEGVELDFSALKERMKVKKGENK